ncbi:sugar ABC transporter permease [Actinopolymorpha sp. NPDC004070]|uniref:carbohydrate ABC transporter permease n=1 Tax=Actinopolymorpha sp. NPDC004070 TaxID=3154548 RepID=UPI0033AC63E5
MSSSTTRPAATRRSGRGRRRPLTFDRVSFFAVFLGLPLVIFFVFVISPFVQALYYSLTDWSGFSDTMNFVGFDNYVRLFQDDQFVQSIQNSIVLGLVVPAVTIVMSLVLATLMTVGGSGTGTVRGLGHSNLYRVVSFFPYTIPGIVIGIIWAQIYDPARGILNAALTSVGLHGFDNFAWLGDARTAMAASMFAIIWSFVGFYMVLFIAAIRGIDPDVFEAARIDGAGRLRTAWSIIVPLIRDNIQTAWVYLGIAALDSFVYMAALNPGGGPQNSTLVMAQELFTTAFTKGRFGYATAMGVMLAVVTLVFAAVVFTVNALTGGRDREARR